MPSSSVLKINDERVYEPYTNIYTVNKNCSKVIIQEKPVDPLCHTFNERRIIMEK